MLSKQDEDLEFFEVAIKRDKLFFEVLKIVIQQTILIYGNILEILPKNKSDILKESKTKDSLGLLIIWLIILRKFSGTCDISRSSSINTMS